MEKKTLSVIMAVVCFMAIVPLSSFKSGNNHQMQTERESRAVVDIGAFLKDGVVYYCFGDNATFTVSGVYTWDSVSGYVPVHSFSNGTWSYNGSSNLVSHLIVKATASSSSFTYSGILQYI